MTDHEYIDHQISILQALKEGKSLQWQRRDGGEWYDSSNDPKELNLLNRIYKVKPEILGDACKRYADENAMYRPPPLPYQGPDQGVSGVCKTTYKRDMNTFEAGAEWQRDIHKSNRE